MISPFLNTSVSIAVSEQSQVGESRRAAANFSAALHFSETIAGKVGIIVSELATNLVKHTPGGEIILRRLSKSGSRGLEILSVDKGPGFDLTKCFRDGYSSAGTSGTGLGSVQRLSQRFDAFSEPGLGTVLLSEMWDRPPTGKRVELEIGVVCLPLKGEEACGDAWAFRKSGTEEQILLVDGLGHGQRAADAAQTALRVFEEQTESEGELFVQACHSAMRSTRGGALAITSIDFDRDLVRYVGVGNIAGVIIDGEKHRNLVSQNGTVGAELHRVTEFQYPWSRDALLVLHSDGLGSRWKLEGYPGIRNRHPSIIAAILYRDFRRDRDDVTVLVASQVTSR